MYDKITKISKCLPIKLVAQELGYYEEADERALADQIERPALRSLAALRQGQHLNDDGRIGWRPTSLRSWCEFLAGE